MRESRGCGVGSGLGLHFEQWTDDTRAPRLMQDCTCVRERGEALQQVELRGHRGRRHLPRGEAPKTLTTACRKERRAACSWLQSTGGGRWRGEDAGCDSGRAPVDIRGKLLEDPSSWRFDSGVPSESDDVAEMTSDEGGWTGFACLLRPFAPSVFALPNLGLPISFPCSAPSGLHRCQAQVRPVHAPHRRPLPGVQTPHSHVVARKFALVDGARTSLRLHRGDRPLGDGWMRRWRLGMDDGSVA